MHVRKALMLGGAFVALLVVIALSAIAVWRSATISQNRVAALHAASIEAAAALSSVRSNVYLTAILTRDYLLETEPSNAGQYLQQFQTIRSELERGFQVLRGLAQDEPQRQALARLKQEVDAYCAPTATALRWTADEKKARSPDLLRQRVHRRREIFELAQRAEKLMNSNFDREQQRVTKADQDFRGSFDWTTAIALAIGAGIAVFTLTRMVALERQSVTAEAKLRELSAQLRTAQESERKQISRELHDEVGQMLTGLRMELAALARLNWSANPEVANRITHAKGTIEQTLKQVRNIAMLVRPSMLDDLGLRPAIAWQTKEFSRQTGVTVETIVDPAADRLPETYRTCIYRIVQEALTNCARHAGATRIIVSLLPENGVLRLSIEDDGVGFDLALAGPRGFGLMGMEERVRELQGRFSIKSTLGRGTRVDTELPLPDMPEVCGDPYPGRGRSRDRQDRLETSL
jgi:signal transduction histidine kinase